MALIHCIKSLGERVERIGLEAGPLSQWLYGALRESGLPVELLETRHVKAALSAMPVKTDRNDARGLAQPMQPFGAPPPAPWKRHTVQPRTAGSDHWFDGGAPPQLPFDLRCEPALLA